MIGTMSLIMPRSDIQVDKAVVELTLRWCGGMCI